MARPTTRLQAVAWLPKLLWTVSAVTERMRAPRRGAPTLCRTQKYGFAAGHALTVTLCLKTPCPLAVAAAGLDCVVEALAEATISEASSSGAAPSAASPWQMMTQLHAEGLAGQSTPPALWMLATFSTVESINDPGLRTLVPTRRYSAR